MLLAAAAAAHLLAARATGEASAGAAGGAVPAAAVAPLILSQDMIRSAVRETLAADAAADLKAGAARRTVAWSTVDTVGTKMAVAFAQAKIPDCLHPDGLRQQPAKIGPVQLGGVLALPFLASAIIGNKCGLP